MSSLGGSQTDLSTLALGDLAIDEPDLFPGADSSSSLPANIPSTDPDAPLTMIAGLDSEYDQSKAAIDQSYSSIQIGQVIDDNSAIFSDPSIGSLRQKSKLARELTPLNFAEGGNETEPLFSDPSSPLSPLFLRDSGFPEDIGKFGETTPPIIYCGRLLCRKFLLAGGIGELIADKDVRVSHKVLALGCLESLCNLYPAILGEFVQLSTNDSQLVSDVLRFADHDDPQIKGNVATLASCWLKSATIRTGHKIEALPPDVTCEVVQVLSKILSDECGVTARLGVAALTKCYAELLEYDVATCLRLMRQAVALAKNPYWLLKVAVSEFLSVVDYSAILSAECCNNESTIREEERFHSLALDKLISILLADGDPRVRLSASNAILGLVEKLCLGTTLPDESAFIRRIDRLSRDFEFSWHLDGFPVIHCLAPGYKVGTNNAAGSKAEPFLEENLSYLIDILIKALCSAVDHNRMIGCLSSLQRLAEVYPPSEFESAWCISNRGNGSSSIEFLSTLLSILKSVSFGADTLLVHQILFSLIGSIFSGVALYDMSSAGSQRKSGTHSLPNERFPSLTSSALGDFANELFNYCLRIVSIYWHAITDQVPAPPPVLTKPPLPQLPQAASLTPVANKLKAVASGGKGETKVQDKADNSSISGVPAPVLPTTKYKAADFYSSIHLMRVFEMVKGSWSNYRISLDSDVEEKYCVLLRSCLDCLNNLLEVASISDVEKFTEELLAYLKPLMPILPAEVVNTVIQLLKSLFGTNLPILFQSNQTTAFSSTAPSNGKSRLDKNEISIYQSCIVQQRTKFFNQLISASARHGGCTDALMRHLGWFGSRGERHVVSLLKNATNKATLTNYIRLFEPIVVQGLRLYTSSVNVDLQCGVIGLLSQLIQIRVNYSLLDTDRRFLEFLFQQLENIEEGNMRNSELLTRKLFEFFTLLSYEKYQSTPVLEVPKILQLADGLLASNQNGKGSGSLGVLALHPVVLDLYFFRSFAKVEAAKELEIQQEVVTSMLIKCMRRGGAALSLLSLILYQTHKENESKWRKLSRDIVDALLPLLGKNQMPLRNGDDLGTLFNLTDFLCSNAFRPVDPILTLMLAQPRNGRNVEEFVAWFACQIWCVRSLITFSNEAAISSRLEEMPSVVVGATWLIGQGGGQCEFVDPLGSMLQTSFEEVLARLLISVCKLALDRLQYSLVTRPTPASLPYLEQLCHYYVNALIHLCQCGNYPKFSVSFAKLLKSDLVDLDESITRTCPELAVNWFCLLSLMKVDDPRRWKMASEYGISPILRRCMIVLYCGLLKESLVTNDGSITYLDAFLANNMDILDWLHEPPVMEFLRFGLSHQIISRIILNIVDQILKENCLKPSRAVKLLQCLEMSDFESSAIVLEITTRFMAKCNHLSVIKMAETLAMRKLDFLMVYRVEETRHMLPFVTIRSLMSSFDGGRKRRFGLLYARLDQLARNWYPDEYSEFLNIYQHDSDSELVESGSPSSIDANTIPSPAKFHRVKFLECLQSVLRTQNQNVHVCAEALCSLSIEDVTEILNDERTTPRLLVACLFSDEKSPQPHSRAQTPPGQQCKPSEIADAARRSLLTAIRTAVTSIPKDFRPMFTKTDFSIIGDSKSTTGDRMLNLANGVYRLFKNSRLRSTLTESELRLFVCYLAATMTHCLKRLDSIKLCHARRLINVFMSAFRCDQFCRVLSLAEFVDQQIQLIGGSFWFCCKALKIKDLALHIGDLPITIEDSELRTAWQYCNAYLHWIETKGPVALSVCDQAAKELLIGLCRLPSVTSFTHIPPSAFKFGWAPELRLATNGYANLPTVPVHYLQNVETLREFVFRVNTLGWSSRQQFEEIWMGLLGVLSATTIGRELLNNSIQETEDRIVASSFAVRCLAALLLQTLLSPTPGNPLASTYLLKPREKQSTFLRSTFGTKLTEHRHHLRCQMGKDNYSDKNLGFGFNPERLHDRSQYSVGQLSLETLWSLTGILAEERDLISGLPRSPTSKLVQNSRISEAYEAGMTPTREVAITDLLEGTAANVERGSSFVSYTDETMTDASGAKEQPEEYIAVRRSTSNFLLISESGLDLVSCLHFLLDLFTHWFAGGPDDVPLPLLSATVESVLYLSDLFTERSQYLWLRERLLAVYQCRLQDDDLLFHDVVLGLLKCSAVLGMNDGEKQKEAMALFESSLRSHHLTVRTAALHGTLYILQALTSDETIALMPALTDYISLHISLMLSGDLGKNLEKPQSLDHQLAVWALGFYVVETFHDPHTKTSFAPKFIELCCKAIQSDHLPIIYFDCVINGLESLLVNTPVEAWLVGKLTKLLTERVQKPNNPQTAVLAMELLLTCLYTSKENRRFSDAASPDNEVAPRIAGEPHISAMERLTVLLTRVTEGSRFEAAAIGSVLPDFLADHFSPSDVMNKVIIELLNPMQPHPQVLIRTLHSLIEALLQQEVPAVVCDWVLVSLPSFTCKNPAHFSVWALTCLLLSASTNAWVKALWPLAMSRYNSTESQLDWRLFCFSINAFYSQLNEKSQVDALIKTIGKAAEKHPNSAYALAHENLMQAGLGNASKL